MVIRIDELNPTALPSRTHELPAMKGGIASKITVGQILDLVIAGAPSGLDTLVELAAAIGNNPSFASDTAAALAARLLKSGGTMTGDLDMGGNDIRKVATLNDGPLAGSRDAIINGSGAVNQRVYTTVADDTYWCDRHYVLTQTAAITPTIVSDVADGLPKMMRLTQSQATAQRMGNAQIIESSAAKSFRGKQITLGGWLRCSSSQAIRYAVVEWTGTADAPISDIVNSWTNGTFTAGQFFVAATTTVAAVATITPSANTLTKWSLTANVSSACNNLIVFMWTEATAAQNVTLDMAWGLVLGDATAETWPYAARPIQQELALCLRYFVSGTAFTQGSRDSSLANGRLRLGFTFPQPMRGIPAMSYPALGGAADGEGSAVSFPQGGGAFNRTNLLGTIFDGFVASGTSTTVNVPWTVTFPYFADAEL